MSFTWSHPQYGTARVPEEFRGAFTFPRGRGRVPVQRASTGFAGYRYQVWRLVRFTDTGEFSYIYAPGGQQNLVRSRSPLRADQVRRAADQMFGQAVRSFSMYDEAHRRIPSWYTRDYEVWETGANGWHGSVVV